MSIGLETREACKDGSRFCSAGPAAPSSTCVVNELGTRTPDVPEVNSSMQLAARDSKWAGLDYDEYSGMNDTETVGGDQKKSSLNSTLGVGYILTTIGAK